MARRKGILSETMKVVNIGIQSFAHDLESQGVKVAMVDWKPPAGGDEEMLRLLEELSS
ncbi:MAG TPA: hypothetical protein VGR56_00520 [Nitrososphaerales archaeon]|nr:hypothetical protein [Nitrososphaerales archaeon]